MYGPPGNPYDDHPSGESVPQVYVRQGDIRLQYTPLGAEVCHSEAGDAALARFQELFHMDRAPSPTRQARFQVRDFRDRIRSLADRLVGRTVELATLRGVLDAIPEGVIWVAGTAGIGKSSLLARIAQDYLEAPPSHTWVLPYWFDAGDARCQRETFLRFAIERLRDWLRVAPPEDGSEAPKPLQPLRDLLQHLNGRRVLFVLDGLDEITGRDPHFARDVPLGLRLPGVVWLCAGRPEQGLPSLFCSEIAHHPFPDRLPPMRESDIRAMLLDNLTGKLRQRLVSQDRERSEQVINPFIDQVAKAAQGLPLYVRYVINDIWAGRYRMLDAGERLPPSLNAYHEDHLRRCAVSSLHQVLTPMVVLLAVVYEEPTADMLAALLRQRTLVPAGEAGLALVREGLNALESMIKRKRDQDGQIRYALHHHSLRQHIQESPSTRQAVETAREFLGDAALQVKPGAAAHYLYRYGIDHLVQDGAGRHQDALRLLTRFNYLIARFHALQDTPVAADLRIDWQTYRRTGGKLDDEARFWETFFRENEHILRRGDDDWPAYKILLQLAIEHADDSPITQQAETWLAQPDNCDWVWLRNPCRPEQIPINPVVRVFEGHADTVNGAIELSDGRILSWSEDCTLRIWDRNDSGVFIEMKGHTLAVIRAQELSDHRILSYSKDDSLRLWNSRNGSSLEITNIEDDKELALMAENIKNNIKNRPVSIENDIDALKALNSLAEDFGDRTLEGTYILSNTYKIVEIGTGFGALWLIDITDNNHLIIREIHKGRVTELKFLSDNYILISENRYIKLMHINSVLPTINYKKIGEYFSGDCRSEIKNLRQHFCLIKGLKILSDDRILSWDFHTLGLWDKHTGKNIVVSPFCPSIENSDIIDNVIVLPNSFFLVETDYRCWYLWDGKNIMQIVEIGDVIPLPNGNLLCLDISLQVKSGTNGSIIMEIIKHANDIKGVNLLPDNRFVSWSNDCNLFFWDIISGKCLKILEGHTDEILGVSIFEDYIISWSKDLTLRLWNTENRECIAVMKGHMDSIVSVVLLPGNCVLSASKDRTLLFWDISDGCIINSIRSEKIDNEKDTLFWFEFESFYKLDNGNLLLNFSSMIYLINGKDKSLITMSPAFLNNMTFSEKIRILSNSNILIFSTESYSKEYAPRIISGLTGEIYPIARDGQYIEKLGIIGDKLYFLLNDGTFGIQSIEIDEVENEYESVPDFKSSIYEYSSIFNVIGNPISNTVKFVDHYIRWEANCAVVCKDMSDDRTYIVSAADGRILCLKLYRGANRITSDELADDDGNSTSE